MSGGNPNQSRWTDGSIPGMRENCSYAGYKGTDRTKGVARRLRQLKRFEAEARDEFANPLSRAIFRRLSPEDQQILIEAEKELNPLLDKSPVAVIS